MKLKFKTNALLTMALLAAISIVLTRFLFIMIPFLGVNSIRLSLGDTPIILAGLLFGPIAGAMTGIVADIIGANFFSPFGYFPGFTLSVALVGTFSGLLKKHFEQKKVSFFKFVLCIILIVIFPSILNTVWLSITTGVSFTLLFWPRLLFSLLLCILYSIVLYPIYNRIKLLIK